MKTFLTIMMIVLLAGISYGAGTFVTDSGGTKIQGCAPALAKDVTIANAIKSSVSVSSDLCFIFTTISTTSGCVVYKSGTTASAGKVGIPLAASATLSRVVGSGVKYLVYSSCSGAIVERQ